MDQALFAAVMAHLHGVSTRKVDDLVTALNADAGIGKAQVSRIAPISTLEVVGFRHAAWPPSGSAATRQSGI
jgi:putative transposase